MFLAQIMHSAIALAFSSKAYSSAAISSSSVKETSFHIFAPLFFGKLFVNTISRINEFGFILPWYRIIKKLRKKMEIFHHYNKFFILSIYSATLLPFSVNFITLILPCFSKSTNFAFSISCRIFTACEYVQSTSLAKILPYLNLVFFLRAINIIAGFLLKNTSNISFFLDILPPITTIIHIIISPIFKCLD